VGANFKFGFRRSGDINTIKNTIKDIDIKLKITPILEDKEGRISSSRIRDLLEKSDLKNAFKMLNRPYSFNGKVVKGKGIGKSIGWPTANLEIDGRKFLPGEGVYTAWTTIGNSNRKFASIMNLGSQPTINPLLPSAVEVHLINEDMNLYGLNLSVEPIEKLRSQIKFENINQLSNQIRKDRDDALEIFKNHDQ
jgi:riboflavin kinase/FMN adenylyltransferase